MGDTGDPAVVFIVTLGAVYEVVAAACSSPQTAEINATRRAGTLMKWVWIGLAQAAAFTAIEIVILRQHNRPIWPAAAGAGTGIVALWGQYAHAKHAGLASTQPSTEDW